MYALWHNKTVPTLYLSESGILRGPSMDRDSDGSSSIYSKNALPLQYKSVKLKCYIKYLISKSVKMLSTRFINKTYTQTSKNYFRTFQQDYDTIIVPWMSLFRDDHFIHDLIMVSWWRRIVIQCFDTIITQCYNTIIDPWMNLWRDAHFIHELIMVWRHCIIIQCYP